MILGAHVVVYGANPPERERVMNARAVLPVLLLAAALPAAAAPLSLREVLALADRKTDTATMVQMVNRECVDFEIDGAILKELCGRVPADVIVAAFRCRAAQQDTAPLVTPVSGDGPMPVEREAPRAPAEKPAPVRPLPPPVAERRAPEPESPDDAWLRLVAPPVRGGCYLFVDYGGRVLRLRQRGTPTSMRLGNWEADFSGEPYWWLPVDAKTGATGAALLPSGKHALTLYCGDGWYRTGLSADLAPGRVHTLVIERGGDDDFKLQGVRLEPEGTPLPPSRERVHSRTAQ
jgi:hypothetical protein